MERTLTAPLITGDQEQRVPAYTLDTLDYAVIGAYFFLVLTIGLRMGRPATRLDSCGILSICFKYFEHHPGWIVRRGLRVGNRRFQLRMDGSLRAGFLCHLFHTMLPLRSHNHRS